MQPHYIYSPREMTRWVRGICEALRPLETLSIEGLVRIWAHEAQRLFQDRSACQQSPALPYCIFFPALFMKCLQCFDAVGWVAGRASGL